MKDIRILIGDLVRACLALHEVKVVAAGSMYATLECDFAMAQKLSLANIHWSYDR